MVETEDDLTDKVNPAPPQPKNPSIRGPMGNGGIQQTPSAPNRSENHTSASSINNRSHTSTQPTVPISTQTAQQTQASLPSSNPISSNAPDRPNNKPQAAQIRGNVAPLSSVPKPSPVVAPAPAIATTQRPLPSTAPSATQNQQRVIADVKMAPSTSTNAATAPRASGVVSAPHTTVAVTSARPSGGTAPAATSVAQSQLASQSHPNKKRRLSRPPPIQTVHQLANELAVMQVVVQQVLGLLSFYGPLTSGQIEYNLPTSKHSIHDVLQVLVALGLVHQVAAEPKASVPGESSSATPQPQQQQLSDTSVRYCVNEGIPRAEMVPFQLPRVLQSIRDAHTEIRQSTERSQRLLQLLRNDMAQTESTNNSKHKEVLKKMLADYPEIKQDPVYATGLKMFHVDVGGTDTNSNKKTPKQSRARDTSQSPPQQPQHLSANDKATKTGVTTPALKQPPPPSSSVEPVRPSLVATQAAAAASTATQSSQPLPRAIPTTASAAAVPTVRPAVSTTPAVSAAAQQHPAQPRGTATAQQPAAATVPAPTASATPGSASGPAASTIFSATTATTKVPSLTPKAPPTQNPPG